nr:hypothetical protein [Salmonella enterica]
MARPCWSYAPEKSWPPCWARTTDSRRLFSRDYAVSKLCRWFGLPRRSWYYRSVKAAPKLIWSPRSIEENPSFGYRTVAALNKDGSKSGKRCLAAVSH